VVFVAENNCSERVVRSLFRSNALLARFAIRSPPIAVGTREFFRIHFALAVVLFE